jgi:hypothetical protein
MQDPVLLDKGSERKILIAPVFVEERLPISFADHGPSKKSQAPSAPCRTAGLDM